MSYIESRIKALAFLGRTPRDIEKKLCMTPYTIHKLYHGCLMWGYELRERNKRGLSTEEKREVLRAIYARDRRLTKQLFRRFNYRDHEPTESYI